MGDDDQVVGVAAVEVSRYSVSLSRLLVCSRNIVVNMRPRSKPISISISTMSESGKNPAWDPFCDAPE